MKMTNKDNQMIAEFLKNNKITQCPSSTACHLNEKKVQIPCVSTQLKKGTI